MSSEERRVYAVGRSPSAFETSPNSARDSSSPQPQATREVYGGEVHDGVVEAGAMSTEELEHLASAIGRGGHQHDGADNSNIPEGNQTAMPSPSTAIVNQQQSSVLSTNRKLQQQQHHIRTVPTTSFTEASNGKKNLTPKAQLHYERIFNKAKQRKMNGARSDGAIQWTHNSNSQPEDLSPQRMILAVLLQDLEEEEFTARAAIDASQTGSLAAFFTMYDLGMLLRERENSGYQLRKIEAPLQLTGVEVDETTGEELELGLPHRIKATVPAVEQLLVTSAQKEKQVVLLESEIYNLNQKISEGEDNLLQLQVEMEERVIAAREDGNHVGETVERLQEDIGYWEQEANRATEALEAFAEGVRRAVQKTNTTIADSSTEASPSPLSPLNQQLISPTSALENAPTAGASAPPSLLFEVLMLNERCTRGDIREQEWRALQHLQDHHNAMATEYTIELEDEMDALTEELQKEQQSLSQSRTENMKREMSLRVATKEVTELRAQLQEKTKENDVILAKHEQLVSEHVSAKHTAVQLEETNATLRKEIQTLKKKIEDGWGRPKPASISRGTQSVATMSLEHTARLKFFMPLAEVPNAELLIISFPYIRSNRNPDGSLRSTRTINCVICFDFFRKTIKTIVLPTGKVETFNSLNLVVAERNYHEPCGLRLVFQRGEVNMVFHTAVERERCFDVATAIHPHVRFFAPQLTVPGGADIYETVIDARGRSNRLIKANELCFSTSGVHRLELDDRVYAHSHDSNLDDTVASLRGGGGVTNNFSFASSSSATSGAGDVCVTLPSASSPLVLSPQELEEEEEQRRVEELLSSSGLEEEDEGSSLNDTFGGAGGGDFSSGGVGLLDSRNINDTMVFDAIKFKHLMSSSSDTNSRHASSKKKLAQQDPEAGLVRVQASAIASETMSLLFLWGTNCVEELHKIFQQQQDAMGRVGGSKPSAAKKFMPANANGALDPRRTVYVLGFPSATEHSVQLRYKIGEVLDDEKHFTVCTLEEQGMIVVVVAPKDIVGAVTNVEFETKSFFFESSDGTVANSVSEEPTSSVVAVSFHIYATKFCCIAATNAAKSGPTTTLPFGLDKKETFAAVVTELLMNSPRPMCQVDPFAYFDHIVIAGNGTFFDPSGGAVSSSAAGLSTQQQSSGVFNRPRRSTITRRIVAARHQHASETSGVFSGNGGSGLSSAATRSGHFGAMKEEYFTDSILSRRMRRVALTPQTCVSYFNNPSQPATSLSSTTGATTGETSENEKSTSNHGNAVSKTEDDGTGVGSVGTIKLTSVDAMSNTVGALFSCNVLRHRLTCFNQLSYKPSRLVYISKIAFILDSPPLQNVGGKSIECVLSSDFIEDFTVTLYPDEEGPENTVFKTFVGDDGVDGEADGSSSSLQSIVIQTLTPLDQLVTDFAMLYINAPSLGSCRVGLSTSMPPPPASSTSSLATPSASAAVGPATGVVVPYLNIVEEAPLFRDSAKVGTVIVEY